MSEAANDADHAGQHALVDLFEVPPGRLVDCAGATAAMRDALAAGGMRILEERASIFPNGGFTAFFLLAESHAAVHTYPERRFAAVDVLSCTNRAVRPIVARIVDYFGPRRAVIRTFDRGGRTPQAHSSRDVS